MSLKAGCTFILMIRMTAAGLPGFSIADRIMAPSTVTTGKEYGWNFQ
jgi:hypothetical protein